MHKVWAWSLALHEFLTIVDFSPGGLQFLWAWASKCHWVLKLTHLAGWASIIRNHSCFLKLFWGHLPTNTWHTQTHIHDEKRKRGIKCCFLYDTNVPPVFSEAKLCNDIALRFKWELNVLVSESRRYKHLTLMGLSFFNWTRQTDFTFHRSLCPLPQVEPNNPSPCVTQKGHEGLWTRGGLKYCRPLTSLVLVVPIEELMMESLE